MNTSDSLNNNRGVIENPGVSTTLVDLKYVSRP